MNIFIYIIKYSHYGINLNIKIIFISLYVIKKNLYVIKKN